MCFFFSDLFFALLFCLGITTRGEKNKPELMIVSRCFPVPFAECQALLLLRQPSEGPGGSKLAFGNEPGSAVGGQQQQAESRAGELCGAR